MVARAIHRASRRAKGPCVAVNCAALTESLIESELFGHAKGAFTGATDKKAGRFEMADRGTLFLDEIGELPLGLQTKFLRVLEERRFERVGGQRALDVDVRGDRFASSRDLAEMVQARHVPRGSLLPARPSSTSRFHRCATWLDDVPWPRRSLPRAVSSPGRPPDHRLLRRTALAAMARYAWPGNVRELRNAVERAIVLGDREQIEAADLPPQGARTGDVPSGRARTSPTPLNARLGDRACHARRRSTACPSRSTSRRARSPLARYASSRRRVFSRRSLQRTGPRRKPLRSSRSIARPAYKKLKDYEIEA